jgi:hypothetical protein
MPATYEKIASTTLGSASATFTLGSIPSTYTDLRLVIVGKGNGGEIYPEGYFNGSVSNISNTYLTGTGSTATSGRNTGYFILSSNVYPNNTFFTFITMDIFSYAGSTFKTCLTTISTDKNGTGGTTSAVTLYRNTSAITSITISDGGSGFGWAVGTTATLYGILRA